MGSVDLVLNMITQTANPHGILWSWPHTLWQQAERLATGKDITVKGEGGEEEAEETETKNN